MVMPNYQIFWIPVYKKGYKKIKQIQSYFSFKNTINIITKF